MKQKLLILVLIILSFMGYSPHIQADLKIVILGSSTARGYGLTYAASQSWVALYRKEVQKIHPTSEVINLSQNSYSTYKIMPSDFTTPPDRKTVDKERNITAALKENPDVIIINLPSNDTSNDVSVDEVLENYKIIVAEANKQNVPVWITTTQPVNFTNEVYFSNLTKEEVIQKSKQQIEINKRLYEVFGDKVIDFWTTLASEDENQLYQTPLLSNYDQGDGVHLNPSGHWILYNRILDTKIHELYDNEYYLVGNATSAKWNLDDMIPLKQNTENPDLFEVECELNINNGNQLKFMLQRSWTGQSLQSLSKDKPLADKQSFVTEAAPSSADNKWTISTNKQGKYRLTINRADKTLTAEFLGEQSYPENIYLVGGATPAGWNLDKAIKLDRDANNKHLFTTTCLFVPTSGTDGNSFKFLKEKSWNSATTLRPTQANKAINESDTYQTGAATNYTWVVSDKTKGYYKLTVDAKNETITAEFLGSLKTLPAQLYLVGDATTAGWDTSKALKFTQDGTQPNIFTLTTTLTRKGNNQLKVMEQRSWAGYSLHSNSCNEILSETNTYSELQAMTSTNPDNKWIVPTDKQGNYKLTIDILTKTLYAEYLEADSNLRSLSIAESNETADINIYAADRSIRVSSQYANGTIKVQVFTLNGMFVVSKASNTNSFVVAQDLPTGVYIVTLTADNKTTSKKVYID